MQSPIEARLKRAFQALAGADDPVYPSRALNALDVFNNELAAGSTYQPWNHDQYIARLGSYKLSTWFGKAKGWTAPECAAHGWSNTGKDTLGCALCGASLVCATVAPDSAQLRSAHRDLCPWQRTSCPASFVHPRPLRGRAGLRACQEAATAIALALQAQAQSQMQARTAGTIRLAPSFMQTIERSSRAAAQVSRLDSAALNGLTSAAPAFLASAVAVEARTDPVSGYSGVDVHRGSTVAPAQDTASQHLVTAALALVLCGWRVQESDSEPHSAPEHMQAGGGSRSSDSGSKRRRTGSLSTASKVQSYGARPEPIAYPSVLRCCTCGALLTLRQIADSCSTSPTTSHSAPAALGQIEAHAATGSVPAPVPRRGLLEVARSAFEAVTRAMSSFSSVSSPPLGSADASADALHAEGQRKSYNALLHLTNDGCGAGVDPLAAHKWHCSTARAAYPLQSEAVHRASEALQGLRARLEGTGQGGSASLPPLYIATTPASAAFLRRSGIAGTSSSTSAYTATDTNSTSVREGRRMGGEHVVAALAAVSAATLGVADMQLISSMFRANARASEYAYADSDDYSAGTGKGRREKRARPGTTANQDAADLHDLLEGIDDVDEEGDIYSVPLGTTSSAVTFVQAPVLLPGWQVHALFMVCAIAREE